MYGGPPPAHHHSPRYPPRDMGYQPRGDGHSRGGGDGSRCNFFSKMGACRHADNCTKLHYRPTSCRVVLFPLMYPNPQAAHTYIRDKEWEFTTFEKKYLDMHFEKFYKDVWRTFMEFGRINAIHVCGNMCDHLLGNVYIQFEESRAAERVCKELHARSFNEILLLPELSPVPDFTDACCKQFRETSCERGSQCNFLHTLPVSHELEDKLRKEQDRYWRKMDKKREKEDRDRRDRDSSRRNRSVEKSGRKRSSSPSHGKDRGGRRKEDLCHICGKMGHISRDCNLRVQ